VFQLAAARGGSAGGGGAVFYKDRLASLAGKPAEYRWERPHDAVAVRDDPGQSATAGSGEGAGAGLAVVDTAYDRARCTRFVFGSEPAEQAWYSADALTKRLKEVSSPLFFS
jgi:hypothetical protein